MRRTLSSIPLLCLALVSLALAGPPASAQEAGSLLEARQGFVTKLREKKRDEEGMPRPPAELFRLETYKSGLGGMQALVSVAPPGAKPGQRFPAILWVTGGWPPGAIGSDAWERPDPDNDQSAQAYRRAGLVMMYPSFRGSCGNPGQQEGFYGEVDDLLAAADHLAKLPYVDPDQLYLGGHSTGGTLALLAAAATSTRFKAVISFGPVGRVEGYGADSLPFDPARERELALRNPIEHLARIKVPTYVIEGSERGNASSVRAIAKASQNPKLRCFVIEGANHFDVLSPLNRHIARELAGGSLELTQEELQAAFDADWKAARESEALGTLARLRRFGVPLDQPVDTIHVLYAWERRPIVAVKIHAAKRGFDASAEITRHVDGDGDEYFQIVLRKQITLGELPALFSATQAVARLAREDGAVYEGWTVSRE